MVIVDDDKRIIENIKRFIPFNSLGIELVATATTAKEGIETISRNTPDIVMSDIMMPDMTGFDMIRSVKDLSLSPIVIMLTGCADFDNAKTAIDENVFSYLVKPATPDEIIETLKRAVLECEKKQTKTSENKQLTTQQDVDRIFTSTSIEEVPDTLMLYDYSCCVTIRDLASNNYRIENLIEILLQNLSVNFKFFNGSKNGDTFTILATFNNESDYNLLTASALNLSHNYNLFICIGSLCEDINKLHLSYNQASDMQKYSFCYDNHPVCINYHEVENRIANKQNTFTFSHVSMYEWVKNDDYEQIQNSLNSIISAFKDYEIYEPIFLKTLIYTYCTILIERVSPEKLDSYTSSDIWDEIQGLKTQTELFEHCRSVVYDYGLFLSQCDSNNTNKLILAIDDYIKENYMNSISLTSLSKHLYYSRNYLRIIFQNHFGTNFRDYLQKYRMKKAASLISSGEYTISAIAEQVGYSDIKTFREVFKKVYGVLPSEYLKNS